MSLIEDIKIRAKKNIKTIVLPESMDIRVLEAANVAARDGLARIIVIGEASKIKELYSEFDDKLIQVINPFNYEDIEIMVDTLFELRRDKGLTRDEAYRLITNDYMYFACMLVKMDMADGVVSGACHSTSNTKTGITNY